MNHFHVCKKFKSFFLVTLSVVILVCSVPFTSFKSHALSSAGGYLGSLALSEYLSLVTYMLTRGYSAPKIAHSEGDLIVSNAGVTGEAERFLNSFMAQLREESQPMADSILRALDNAARTGKLALTEEQDAFLRDYFDSLTVDQSVVLGYSTEKFYPVAAGTPINLTFSYFNTNTPTIIKTSGMSFTFDSDVLPVIYYYFNSQDVLQYIRIVCIPLEKNFGLVNPSTQNIQPDITYFDADFPIQSFYFNRIDLEYQYGYGYAASLMINTSYPYDNLAINNFNFGSDFISSAGDFVTSQLVSITALLRTDGFFTNQVAYESTQVQDTSDVDVLSTSSTVDAVTGALTGGMTVYLPQYQTLVNLLQDFFDGTISWISAIKALGLSTVASSATTTEKENALENVSVPDSTYQWITETTWGSETITNSVTEGLTEAQSREETGAESLADRLGWPSGEEPDENDKNKAGNAMLLATIATWLGLWKWPDTDPTAPDGGGTDPSDNPEEQGRVADVVGGIGVTASLIGDIFDAAGGSSGYGMIYTVGISFVLFSVIIGAGHFLGALGNHQEIQGNVKNNNPDKPANSGKQVARSGQHRHIKVKKGA